MKGEGREIKLFPSNYTGLEARVAARLPAILCPSEADALNRWEFPPEGKQFSLWHQGDG